jgi:hypothetical protein
MPESMEPFGKATSLSLSIPKIIKLSSVRDREPVSIPVRIFKSLSAFPLSPPLEHL